MCWSYACVPPSFSGQSFDIAFDLPAPKASGFISPSRRALSSASSAGGSSKVVIVLLHPACASSKATADSKGSGLDFASDMTLTVPPLGIDFFNITTRVSSGCNNQYVALIVSAQSKPNILPPAPTASCPCWSTPQGGVCDGIRLPITLSTIPEFPSAYGQSYQQCIDPANFDPYTGRMAMSYCWRYACLPPLFSSSKFNATITLSRWNIKRMPGNATFNTTLQLTKGVAISVYGPPKSSDETPISFNGTALSDDRNNIGNITLPGSGVGNLTFTWVVPIGFDDLSAAVVMDAYPGPPPPSPPPHPPGTFCGCMGTPDSSTGLCAAGTTLAIVALSSTPSVSYKECIPNAQYNLFASKFAFSMCYSWSCWPSAFQNKPVTISVPNITETNIAQMPAGIWQVRINDLKPSLVNMSVSVVPVSSATPIESNYPGVCGNDTKQGTGPWTSNLDVCLPALSSIGIQFDVPAFPWLDGNSVAVEMILGPTPPFPPNPPSPPPAPPLPPLPPIPVNATVVVASFVVLDYVSSQDALNRLLQAQSAAITANLNGYLLTMPLSFTDFNSIADCTKASQLAFLTGLAPTLSRSLKFTVTPSQLSSSCSYSTINVGSRKLRSLMQLPDSSASSPCTSSLVNLIVSWVVPSGIVSGYSGGIDGVISSTEGSLFSEYNNSRLCIQEFLKSSVINVNQLMFGNTSSNDTVTPNGGSPVRRTLINSGVSSAECSGLVSLINVPSSKVVNASCTTITVDGRTYFTDSSSSGSNNAASNTAAIIGAIVGAAGIIAIGAVVAFFVVKAKRNKNEAAINQAMAGSNNNNNNRDLEILGMQRAEAKKAAIGARTLIPHQTFAATADNRASRMSGAGIMLVDPSKDPRPHGPNARRTGSGALPSSPASESPRMEGMVMRDASLLMPPPQLRKEASASAFASLNDEVSEFVSPLPVNSQLAASKSGFRAPSLGRNLQVSTSEIELFKEDSHGGGSSRTLPPRSLGLSPENSGMVGAGGGTSRLQPRSFGISPESSGTMRLGGTSMPQPRSTMISPENSSARKVPFGWGLEPLEGGASAARSTSGSGSRPGTANSLHASEASEPEDISETPTLADAIGRMIGAQIKKA